MPNTVTAKFWGWISLASIAGGGLGAIGAAVFMHVSPLITHPLRASLSEANAKPPATLRGLADLPTLVSGEAAANQWAIVGGALLEVGLNDLSTYALNRAIARDRKNPALHVALGEAMVLGNGGLVTDPAKAEFDFALRADANDLIARFYVAHWLLQNGNPKLALVKWVGLMRTVGSDPVWYARLWTVLPVAAEEVGVSKLALEALCTAGM